MTRTTGPMTRQPGETIISYISRRKRCYKRLTLLDEATVISENILSDSLMDCSNITEQEKLSIRTLAGDADDFETIANHMQRICRDVHTKETRRGDGGAMPGGDPAAAPARMGELIRRTAGCGVCP